MTNKNSLREKIGKTLCEYYDGHILTIEATDQILALFKKNILNMVEVDEKKVAKIIDKHMDGGEYVGWELAEAISKSNVIRMKKEAKDERENKGLPQKV